MMLFPPYLKADGREKQMVGHLVREFTSIFDSLYNQIPTDYRSSTLSARLLYMNAFEGQFRYILKDKKPTSLAEAKEFNINIEENLLDSKIEPFQYPRNKTESRTKVSNTNVLDPIALLTQKIFQMNTQVVQVKDQLMNRMTAVKRNQFAPRSQFARQQRDATGWKPRPQQEAKASDTETCWNS
jgi:hypothetical protein